jgi:hypothetical protein
MNYYSYSLHSGMQYHPTGPEAKSAAEEAIRVMSADPAIYSPTDLMGSTWGEITERATPTGEVGYALRRQDRLSYEAAYPQVIDGRMMTAEGDLRLLQNIHEPDLLEHDMVLSIACIWEAMSARIARFKQNNFQDVTVFADLIFENYQAKRGGKEGGVGYTTFDKKYKLIISIQKALDLGPEIMVAKAKMLEAIEQAGGDSDFKALVTAAYSMVDGKVSVAKILGLRRVKISNALWNEALTIAIDAIEVISKKRQLRLYKKNDAGKYISIPLDIAAI